jgi:hypothetical protein
MCGLAACSADLGGTDDGAGAAPRGNAAAEPQTGQYSGLPEPCGSVNDDTLRDLLPGGEPEVYPGEPVVTYDTGRRVGCEWYNAGEASTQHLSVDFQRVISYDPAISDDDQAELDFEERAAEAGIPMTVESPADPLEPRVLDGIGDVALVDDQLTGTDPGNRRAVTVAFRNANVLVTVGYTVSATQTDVPPDSAQLQQGARTVAQQLEGALEG